VRGPTEGKKNIQGGRISSHESSAVGEVVFPLQQRLWGSGKNRAIRAAFKKIRPLTTTLRGLLTWIDFESTNPVERIPPKSTRLNGFEQYSQILVFS
jgi:hypothetical protein